MLDRELGIGNSDGTVRPWISYLTFVKLCVSAYKTELIMLSHPTLGIFWELMRQYIQSPQALLKEDALEILVLLPRGIVMTTHFKTFFTYITKINSACIKNREARSLICFSLFWCCVSLLLPFILRCEQQWSTLLLTPRQRPRVRKLWRSVNTTYLCLPIT